MNREAHLRQTLPQWLKLPGIDEIVVVDWSTKEPITDLLDLDPRVRIVRAIDEPRWILSYAYNLGIAHARGDVIFKCDADCMPHPEVLGHVPATGKFFAGDWRTGEATSKICVNGQCLFTKAQWEEVNGYSEVIRRYGYDDTDFYQRLERAGHVRTEISPAHLDFAEHTDKERVANHTAPSELQSIDAFLHQQIYFHEATNLVIIAFLPWGGWFPRAPFEVVSETQRLLTVRRVVSREIPIAPALSQIARTHAIRAVTGKLCRVAPTALSQMNDASCLAMLSRFAKGQPLPAGVSTNGAPLGNAR